MGSRIQRIKDLAKIDAAAFAKARTRACLSPDSIEKEAAKNAIHVGDGCDIESLDRFTEQANANFGHPRRPLRSVNSLLEDCHGKPGKSSSNKCEQFQQLHIALLDRGNSRNRVEGADSTSQVSLPPSGSYTPPLLQQASTTHSDAAPSTFSVNGPGQQP